MRTDRAPFTKAVGPPSLPQQLQRLQTRLKRSHPELLSVGLGHRQRRGEAVPETTVKFIVMRKYSRLPKHVRPLPQEVPLTVLALGQPVTVTVPTDVEQVETARSTSFSVDGMVASGLATWGDAAGNRCVGVITASHGVTNRTQVPVAVRTAPGQDSFTSVTGAVVAAASLKQTGLDIALVQVAVPAAMLFDINPVPLPVMAPAQALATLSGSDSDNFVVSMETWATDPRTTIRGLAYFQKYPLRYADGTFRYLREVVYATAPVKCFSPGTSGGIWATIGFQPGEFILALQSHALGPNKAVGNLLACAVDWLAKQPGINGLRVAWRVQDLLG